MSINTAEILRLELATQSRRKLAAAIGVRYWDITDVLNGHAGLERENRVRRALGLEPLATRVTVEIDPSTHRIVTQPYRPPRRGIFAPLIV